MSWSNTTELIVGRLDVTSRWDRTVLCVLGPPGAGKSEALRTAYDRARTLGYTACYLDLRSVPSTDVDDLFDWALHELKSCGWPIVTGLKTRARLDFVRRLSECSVSFPGHGLLVMDHIESMPEQSAKVLVASLREYSELGCEDESRRTLCVVGGCTSMIDLRKRANSPNLQFDTAMLPPWDDPNLARSVQQYIESRLHRLADSPVLRQLGELTGGDPGFLAMLGAHFSNGNPVTKRDAQRAAKLIVQNATENPDLRRIIASYLLEPELRRCADLLLNGREAYLRDGGSVLHDLDRFQLLGVLVAQSERPYRYRLRNRIVEEVIRSVRDAEAGRENDVRLDGLESVCRELRLCAEGPTPIEWRKGLAASWKLLHNADVDIELTVEPPGNPPTDDFEPWCTHPPDAACWISDEGGGYTISAEAQVRGPTCVKVGFRAGNSFRATVHDRHATECWLAFFARNAERAALLHFAAIGAEKLKADHLEHEQSKLRRRKVFVVYGRDTDRRDALYEFLNTLGLEPIDWQSAKKLTGTTAPSVFDVVDTGMRNAQACIVLLTGDDEGRLKPEFWEASDGAQEREYTSQPRANVIFEAGMALGKYQDRTILTRFGKLRPFSDLGGFVLIDFKEDLPFRTELRNALAVAGCPVDAPGNKWKKAGQFAQRQKASV